MSSTTNFCRFRIAESLTSSRKFIEVIIFVITVIRGDQNSASFSLLQAGSPGTNGLSSRGDAEEMIRKVFSPRTPRLRVSPSTQKHAPPYGREECTMHSATRLGSASAQPGCITLHRSIGHEDAQHGSNESIPQVSGSDPEGNPRTARSEAGPGNAGDQQRRNDHARS